jgi:hypothetical protein|tara:strand:- start:2313 stop:3464 length:1152 start_codon:yes stop_codon:yes gene_type:complete
MKNKYTLIAILFCLTYLSAEPYIAVRTGYKCSQCHVNRTGGGKRTGFGFVYSQTNLPTFLAVSKQNSGLFTNRINEFISIGSNFRVGNKTIMGTDSTRNLVGEEKDPKNNNSIIIPEANVYLEISAIPDKLLFYIDENFAPGASNREAFAMVYNLPLNSYVKFGRIMMPFGLRLMDDGSDGSYVRQKTGFNSYGKQETAFEFGIEPGPFSFITAIGNGQDASSMDKQITSVGSVVYRRFRLGASLSYNKGEEFTDVTTGFFAGGYHGIFTWMFEKDFVTIKDADGNGLSWFGKYEDAGDQSMTYLSLDMRLYRGVNLKVSWDQWDPMVKWETEERDRWTFGLELFPIQYLQTSIFYRYRTAPDLEIYNADNEDQVYFEMHFFF